MMSSSFDNDYETPKCQVKEYSQANPIFLSAKKKKVKRIFQKDPDPICLSSNKKKVMKKFKVYIDSQVIKDQKKISETHPSTQDEDNSSSDELIDHDIENCIKNLKKAINGCKDEESFETNDTCQ